jgi:hypothetical protein
MPVIPPSVVVRALRLSGLMTTVTLVPEVIDADTLAFAAVRAAHLEPPRQVADGLLAAADWPDARLKGVTAYEARMRAAEVLNSAGDRAGALKVLDSSRDTAGAGLIERASKCLGSADPAGAQALVSQIRSWLVGDPYGISLVMAFLLKAADAGYFDEALAWTDAAWTRLPIALARTGLCGARPRCCGWSAIRCVKCS